MTNIMMSDKSSTQNVVKHVRHWKEVPSFISNWPSGVENDASIAQRPVKYDTCLPATIPSTFLPRINCPQRSSTPITYNSPRRVEPKAAQIGSGVLNSFRAAVKTVPPPPSPKSTYISSLRKKVQMHNSFLRDNDPSLARKRIKDLSLLADAMQRAGKKEEEALAYYKIGVVCDNSGRLDEALTHYHRYIALCIEIGDVQGEAHACNCLGIDYQKVGDYEKAIAFHQRHAEIADLTGTYTAQSNLGLIYIDQDRLDQAVACFQRALEAATAMNNQMAQSMTLAHMAVINRKRGDLGTARQMMRTHLELTSSTSPLNHHPIHGVGSTAPVSFHHTITLHPTSPYSSSPSLELAATSITKDALQELGLVAYAQGQFDEAMTHFSSIIDVAKRTGNVTEANQAKVHLGFAAGNLKFQDHIQQLLTQGSSTQPQPPKRKPSERAAQNGTLSFKRKHR